MMRHDSVSKERGLAWFCCDHLMPAVVVAFFFEGFMNMSRESRINYMRKHQAFAVALHRMRKKKRKDADGRLVYRFEHFFDNDTGCPCGRGRTAQELRERRGMADTLAEAGLEWEWAREGCDNRNYRAAVGWQQHVESKANLKVRNGWCPLHKALEQYLAAVARERRGGN